MIYSVRWHMLAAGGGHICGVEQVAADSKISAIREVLEYFADDEADVYSCGGWAEIGDLCVAVRDITGQISRIYCVDRVSEEGAEINGQSQKQSC